MSQFFASGGQSIGFSPPSSVLPMNIQNWFPLGWTVGSPCSPRDSQCLLQHHGSKATIFQHSPFFIVQLSHPYMTTGKTKVLKRWTKILSNYIFKSCVPCPFVILCLNFNNYIASTDMKNSKCNIQNKNMNSSFICFGILLVIECHL